MNPRPGAARRHLPHLVALLATALVTAVTTAALVVASAASASAHDRLLAADPADGATLDAAPSELTLTFSGEVLGTGSQAAVTTPDGTEAAAVAVDGDVVTVTVPGGLPGGEWTVAWRVVSADGHPIEGELTYDVASADDPAGSPTDEPTDEPTEQPTDEPTDTAEPDEETTSAAPGHQHGEPGAELGDNGEANWTMSWLFGVGVLAAVGVAAAVLLARRRREADDDLDGLDDELRDGPDDGPDGAAGDGDVAPGTTRPRG